MPYNITKYSYDQARKLGVIIKPSSVKGKKIDVFKDGEKVASIGDINYSDYATTKNKDQRRRYRIRHAGENKKPGTSGFWAWRLLW